MINFAKSLLVWTMILLQITGGQQQQHRPVDIALVIDLHGINAQELDPNADPTKFYDPGCSLLAAFWYLEHGLYDGRRPGWLDDVRLGVFVFDDKPAFQPTVMKKFSEPLYKTWEWSMTWASRLDMITWRKYNDTVFKPYSISSFGTIARDMYSAIQRDIDNRPDAPDVVIWFLNVKLDNDAVETIVKNRVRHTNPCDNHVNVFLVMYRYPVTNSPCYVKMYGRSAKEENFFPPEGGGLLSIPPVHADRNYIQAIRLALSAIDQCQCLKGSREIGQCYFDNNGDCKIRVSVPPGCQDEPMKACDRSDCERLCKAAEAEQRVDVTKCNADCDATGTKTTWSQRAANGERDYINCPKTTAVQCSGIKCECTPVPKYSGECYFDSSASCVVKAEMKAPPGITDNARRHCEKSGLLGQRVQPCNKGADECQRLCDNAPDRVFSPCDAECELEGKITSVPKNRPSCKPKVGPTCTGPPCTCQWEKVVNTTIDCHFHDGGTCAKVIKHRWDPNMEERYRQHCPSETDDQCEKKKCEEWCDADEQYKDACVGDCFKMGTMRVRSMKAVQNVRYYHNCPEKSVSCFVNCTADGKKPTAATRPTTVTWTTETTRSKKPTKSSPRSTSTTSSLSTAKRAIAAQTESPGSLEPWHIVLIVLLMVLIIFLTIVVILIVTNRRKRRRLPKGHGYRGGGGARDRSGRDDKRKSPRDAGHGQGRQASRDRGQEHGRHLNRGRDRSEGPSGGRTKPPSRESCQLSKTGKRTPPRARHESPRPPQSPRARSGGRRR